MFSAYQSRGLISIAEALVTGRGKDLSETTFYGLCAVGTARAYDLGQNFARGVSEETLKL